MLKSIWAKLRDEGEFPTGWNFNPSSWEDRISMLGLSVTGLGICVYMALYQYRALPSLWEPFFRDPDYLLRSSALAFPLGVGSSVWAGLAFLLETALGAVGGRHRWRTQPGVVLACGAATVCSAAAGVLLLIVQPVVFGAYNTMWLSAATASVLVVGFSLTEVLACLQHLRGVQSQGFGVPREATEGA